MAWHQQTRPGPVQPTPPSPPTDHQVTSELYKSSRATLTDRAPANPRELAYNSTIPAKNHTLTLARTHLFRVRVLRCLGYWGRSIGHRLMASLSRRLHTGLAVFAVLVVVVFLAGASVAGAARPAPAASSGGGSGEEEAAAAAAYLVMDPSAAVEKARETVAMLMARLPAGPSPKGPGH